MHSIIHKMARVHVCTRKTTSNTETDDLEWWSDKIFRCCGTGQEHFGRSFHLNWYLWSAKRTYKVSYSQHSKAKRKTYSVDREAIWIVCVTNLFKLFYTGAMEYQFICVSGEVSWTQTFGENWSHFFVSMWRDTSELFALPKEIFFYHFFVLFSFLICWILWSQSFILRNATQQWRFTRK